MPRRLQAGVCDKVLTLGKRLKPSTGSLPALLFTMLALANPVAADDASENKGVTLMYQREAPREFDRYPEAIELLLDQAGGWYSQVNATAVTQRADDSLTGNDGLTTFSYNVSGAWRVVPGSTLSWWVRGGRPVGDSKNSNLSRDIGALTDVNATIEDEPIYLRELFWSQSLGSRTMLTAGFIDSEWRYDFNRMANNEQSNFLAAAFVNSPTIPFPDSSIAVDAAVDLTPWADVHFGIYQTNCDKESLSCFSELSSDDWLAPLEFVLRSDLTNLGRGTYRILAFTSNRDNKRGSGISVSMDQQLGRFIPFLRAGFSDADVSEVKRFFSVGTGFEAPLGRPWDLIGAGVAISEPSDDARNTETLFEIYWRFRLNPFVSLTPDLQVILDPADNPVDSTAVVAGLRLQLDF